MSNVFFLMAPTNLLAVPDYPPTYFKCVDYDFVEPDLHSGLCANSDPFNPANGSCFTWGTGCPELHDEPIEASCTVGDDPNCDIGPEFVYKTRYVAGGCAFDGPTDCDCHYYEDGMDYDVVEVCK